MLKYHLPHIEKKNSYGHGFIKVNNPINLKNFVVKNMKDKKSDIYINGQKIKEFNKQTFNIVYKKKNKFDQ